ncbi:MAG: hypothetical protein HY391_04780 [Deltaproteobacteria bacterium]|nr:hypothetical protein [Deltaproteobacteria bacterium]
MIEGIIALMMLTALLFVVAPLFFREKVAEDRYAFSESLQRQAEKENLYAAIREIDLDYRMDKLEEGDWRSMRRRLIEQLALKAEDVSTEEQL